MLLSLILIPLIGAFTLMPFSFESSDKTSISPKAKDSMQTVRIESIIKQIALFTTICNFLWIIVIWSQFDSSLTCGEYQFQSEFNKANFCHFNLGLDGISLYFVLLTTFIIPICILSNWNNIKYSIKNFLIAFLILESLLIATFTVLDILLFYVFFESVLIPLFLIVGIWGGSASRVRASFLLFLYTLFGSLFILLAFLVIYYNIGSTDFQIISLTSGEISLESQKILFVCIFLSIAVKTPLLPFHVWLPRAHAEAPLGGSVVLAGLILKLATYGYIRILIQFLPDATNYFIPIVQAISVITLIYASLSTLRQTDFKALVAYSSIGHIAVVVLGLFSNTIQGQDGALLLSVAHGVVSPALFILCGGVLYDRYHTRIIRYYRGITSYIPIFSVLFFVFTIFNAAVPLSANWAGEFLSLTGIFQRNPIICLLGATGIVLSAAYSIWLYNRMAFGEFSKFLTPQNDISRREYMLLLPLLIVSIIFGIFPNVMLDQVHISISNLIYNLSSEQIFSFLPKQIY